VHSWNTFGARIHKTHHGSDLGETTTFPLILFSMLSHGACTKMSFCFGTPKLGILKFSKLGLWMPITFCVNLRLRWFLKQTCSPHRELYKSMWHATFTQGNWGNFRLIVVENQNDIDSLTPNVVTLVWGSRLK